MPSLIEPPVRLCCGQRHYDVVCPDGKVMCCICFRRFNQDDLNVTSSGQREDVCRECAVRELILSGAKREQAISIICASHYTRSVPSGKSHYIKFEEAIIVWSIPANKNIARFVLGWPGTVWELSRLWAPDGHDKNLLTRAIKVGVKAIKLLERPDALVSYADPNAGHHGGIYRAASWIYHGRSEESRSYRNAAGTTVARRAFHSGGKGMKKAEIEALGYTELKLPGKERFVKPLTRRARRSVIFAEE